MTEPFIAVPVSFNALRWNSDKFWNEVHKMAQAQFLKYDLKQAFTIVISLHPPRKPHKINPAILLLRHRSCHKLGLPGGQMDKRPIRTTGRGKHKLPLDDTLWSTAKREYGEECGKPFPQNITHHQVFFNAHSVVFVVTVPPSEVFEHPERISTREIKGGQWVPIQMVMQLALQQDLREGNNKCLRFILNQLVTQNFFG